MSTIKHNSEEEQLILRRDDARQQAERFNLEGGNDPRPDIPRALLSAEHIIEYVRSTAMIAPLYDGKRMKKASYQGKIGENAYEYNDSGELVCVPIGDKLVVKANSIVFVECDIDFRLPDFIAVRFNLHIRHVHRGLLLGTGPLVDPGYWGKLCIPLHNLTNEDYPIPKNEGLIWIEFTKTSRESIKGRNPSSSNAEYWDIRKFIERAANQYRKRRVAIRSSIPVAMQKYRKMAESAQKSAETSELSAKNAEGKVRMFTLVGYITGIIGIVTIFFGIVTNIYEVGNLVRDSVHPQIEDIKSKIEDMEGEIRDLRNQLDTQTQERNSWRNDEVPPIESKETG